MVKNAHYINRTTINYIIQNPIESVIKSVVYAILYICVGNDTACGIMNTAVMWDDNTRGYTTAARHHHHHQQQQQ